MQIKDKMHLASARLRFISLWLGSRWCRLGFLLVVCAFALPAVQSTRSPRPDRRPVTVADIIGLTRLGHPNYTAGALSKGLVAQFSPDRTRFVVVLRKGNLENNTNDYSVLLWSTQDAFQAGGHEVLLTFSSSSNREAVKNVSWLDNETFAFLGEKTGELQQLYLFNVVTRRIEKLTNHSSNLISYTMTTNGERVVFAAEETASPLLTEKVKREGVRITTQYLPNLLAGMSGREPWMSSALFLRDRNLNVTRRIHLSEQIPGSHISGLTLSPDGRYLVVPAQVLTVPESWLEYEDRFLRDAVLAKRPKGVASYLQRYMLVDLDSGESKVLIDAPLGLAGSEVAWAPDSLSVVVTGTYLPLEIGDPAERAFRRSSTFVVEVTIPSREVTTLSDRDFELLNWDFKTNRILFETDRLAPVASKRVAFGKVGSVWKEVYAPELCASAEDVEILLEEDMASPPRIFITDAVTGHKKLLLDLNPGLARLSLGKVAEIEWKGADGNDAKGGLYLPPNYVPGKRYPLVIQTHRWVGQRFWIDGPWTTASAAQALAGKGFMVLQADESFDDIGTPKEVLREVARLEGAIDHLDRIGLVDRERVGVVGFSRTCLFVKYALTHSKYKLGAAVVADGIDAGYVSYMLFSNSLAGWTSGYEGINSAFPFGDGLPLWLERSPGFNLHNVGTPLMIQAIGRGSLLLEWEWFAGLSRLGKPVDMLYLPEGTHVLEKPWEQYVSKQSVVDWFCFWLKGEEDPDPAKVEQYTHWRELRKHRVEPASPTGHE